MNKYTEIIETCLESETGLSGVFSELDDEFTLFTNKQWNFQSKNKLTALIADSELKLTYIYLLSIVDQETADEMIELLKEPV